MGDYGLATAATSDERKTTDNERLRTLGTLGCEQPGTRCDMGDRTAAWPPRLRAGRQQGFGGNGLSGFPGELQWICAGLEGADVGEKEETLAAVESPTGIEERFHPLR